MLLVSCSCYLKPFNPVSVTNVSALVSTSYYLSVALSACLFQVESLVLTAAAEGRWEAIQQAFDQPGQGGVVREARNKVSWGRTTRAILFLTIILRCCEYFVFCCSMQYGWTSLHFAAHNGHLHLVKKLIKVCGMNPDQQSKVQVDCLCVYYRTHVLHVCVGSTICQGINECENIGTFI